MIKANELRIGNWVFWNPNFIHQHLTIELMVLEVTAILHDKIGYTSVNIENRSEPFEDDLITTDTLYKSLEELQSIPLTDDWLKKLPAKINYPHWVKYLHEFQNWYYWNNDKKEAEIQK